MNSGEGGQVVPLHGAAASKRQRGTDPGGSAGPDGAARRARRTPEVRRTPPADPTGIELTYTHQHLWSSNGEDTPEVWHVSADALPDDGDPAGGSHVGDIEIVLANPYAPDAFGVLDGYTADLGSIGGVVLDVGSGGLDPDFAETLEGPGSDLLILNSVQLTQQWRGFGIGVLPAGLAIRKLVTVRGRIVRCGETPGDLALSGVRDWREFVNRLCEKLDEHIVAYAAEHHLGTHSDAERADSR